MKTILECSLIVLMFISVIVVINCLTSCSEEERAKTLPEVNSSPVTEIATTTAIAGGEIINDGNAQITAIGVVYSDVISEPTLADERTISTEITSNFTSPLTNLRSGVTYRVRAYATNKLGTAYGEVVQFTTDNASPIVSNVGITGTTEVNEQLQASYTYADAEGDAESGTMFQWFVATSATGEGEIAIPGANAVNYLVRVSDQAKFIRVAITPIAATGNTTGTQIKSAFVGAIGDDNVVTFVYNGSTVTYGTINSLVTGRKWLDRNLGASNTPSALNDYHNYGDLFQWGRQADGHQLIVRTGPNAADISGVTGMTSVNPPYEYSSSDNPGHNKFILISNGEFPADWRMPQNNSLWQGVSGTNNPCPSGWRIPSKSEWDAENLDIDNASDGYSKLKLTLTGLRKIDGAFDDFFLTQGYYWVSTIDPGQIELGQVIVMHADGTAPTIPYSTFLGRATGFACRCIKD